jgi:hypothetical protein
MEIPNPDKPINVAVLTVMLDAIELLGDLGLPRRISWISTSDGDEAGQINVSNDGGRIAELRKISPLPDLIGAAVDIDLLVLYPRETLDRTLRRAGSILIEFDENLGNDGCIYLNLSLGADIYAPRVRSTPHHNRELADLNAPRVNRFLRSAEQHLGVQFTYLEFQGYEGQVAHDGFVGY